MVPTLRTFSVTDTGALLLRPTDQQVGFSIRCSNEYSAFFLEAPGRVEAVEVFVASAGQWVKHEH